MYFKHNSGIMKSVYFYIIAFLSISTTVKAQNDIHFNNIDSLWAYAEKNSVVTKMNEQQSLLAKYQKIASITNVINLRDQVTFTLNNNISLPVNYIPAEMLGGKPGTFKQLTFGQQYVGNFSFVPQIDIINPASWAKIKSANINQEMTENNNLINKKNLFESIAACYFNIISLNEQLKTTRVNLALADTLLINTTNKFNQGIVRQQDLNDALTNQLSLNDKINQIQANIKQQYCSLKVLCDAPEDSSISIEAVFDFNKSYELKVEEPKSDLQYKSALLQAKNAKSEIIFNKLSYLPVLSLLYSSTYYQNSNKQFFDNSNGSKWLNSGYIGAKLTFNLPDVNRYFSTKYARVNYQIALDNEVHSKLQNQMANNQLSLDYEKAVSQYICSKKILELKTSNYTLALNQYNETILTFDRLQIAFNDMYTSGINCSNALATLLYSKSRIELNNKIK